MVKNHFLRKWTQNIPFLENGEKKHFSSYLSGFYVSENQGYMEPSQETCSAGEGGNMPGDLF